MSATTESSPATLTVVGNPCANEGNFPAGMTRTDTIFSFERVGLQVGGAMLKRKRRGCRIGILAKCGPCRCASWLELETLDRRYEKVFRWSRWPWNSI